MTPATSLRQSARVSKSSRQEMLSSPAYSLNGRVARHKSATFSQTPGDGVDCYAREYVTAPTAAFTRAPEDFTPAEAATLTSAAVTVWRASMVNGGLKAGDRVLVQGSGGVSIFALQIARAAGATVIATSSSDEKLERMRALGASHTINCWTNPHRGNKRSNGRIIEEWTTSLTSGAVRRLQIRSTPCASADTSRWSASLAGQARLSRSFRSLRNNAICRVALREAG